MDADRILYVTDRDLEVLASRALLEGDLNRLERVRREQVARVKMGNEIAAAFQKAENGAARAETDLEAFMALHKMFIKHGFWE